MAKEFQITDDERELMCKMLTGAMWITKPKSFEDRVIRDMWRKRWVNWGGTKEDNIWGLPDDLYEVLRNNARAYVLSPLGKTIARQLRLEPLTMTEADERGGEE